MMYVTTVLYEIINTPRTSTFYISVSSLPISTIFPAVMGFSIDNYVTTLLPDLQFEGFYISPMRDEYGALHQATFFYINRIFISEK